MKVAPIQTEKSLLGFQVAIGTMDFEKVSEERLSTSQFRIRSEAYLLTGQRIDLGTLVLKPSELESDEEDENGEYFNRNRINVDRDYEDKLGKDVILKHKSVKHDNILFHEIRQKQR